MKDHRTLFYPNGALFSPICLTVCYLTTLCITNATNLHFDTDFHEISKSYALLYKSCSHQYFEHLITILEYCILFKFNVIEKYTLNNGVDNDLVI